MQPKVSFVKKEMAEPEKAKNTKPNAETGDVVTVMFFAFHFFLLFFLLFFCVYTYFVLRVRR